MSVEGHYLLQLLEKSGSDGAVVLVYTPQSGEKLFETLGWFNWHGISFLKKFTAFYSSRAAVLNSPAR